MGLPKRQLGDDGSPGSSQGVTSSTQASMEISEIAAPWEQPAAVAAAPAAAAAAAVAAAPAVGASSRLRVARPPPTPVKLQPQPAAPETVTAEAFRETQGEVVEPEDRVAVAAVAAAPEQPEEEEEEAEEEEQQQEDDLEFDAADLLLQEALQEEDHEEFVDVEVRFSPVQFYFKHFVLFKAA